MGDKTWKQAERRVAALFGTTRTPLSGGNGKQTRSDTLHERLFIETKYRGRFALVDLFIETAAKAAKELKLPVVALVERRQKLIFALVPLRHRYLCRLLDELTENEAPEIPVHDQEGVTQWFPKRMNLARAASSRCHRTQCSYPSTTQPNTSA